MRSTHPIRDCCVDQKEQMLNLNGIKLGTVASSSQSRQMTWGGFTDACTVNPSTLMIDWNCLHDSSCRSWQRPIDAPMNYCGTIIHRQIQSSKERRNLASGPITCQFGWRRLQDHRCHQQHSSCRQLGSSVVIQSPNPVPPVQMTVPMLKNDRPGPCATRSDSS